MDGQIDGDDGDDEGKRRGGGRRGERGKGQRTGETARRSGTSRFISGKPGTRRCGRASASHSVTRPPAGHLLRPRPRLRLRLHLHLHLRLHHHRLRPCFSVGRLISCPRHLFLPVSRRHRLPVELCHCIPLFFSFFFFFFFFCFLFFFVFFYIVDHSIRGRLLPLILLFIGTDVNADCLHDDEMRQFCRCISHDHEMDLFFRQRSSR